MKFCLCMGKFVLFHPADKGKFAIALWALVLCRKMSICVCLMGTGCSKVFRTRSTLNENSMFLSMVCIPASDVTKRFIACANFTLKIIPGFPASYSVGRHMEGSFFIIT